MTAVHSNDVSLLYLVSYPGKKCELLHVPLPSVTSPEGVELHGC